MKPEGIAGLEGVEPIGAALSVGIKGPRGNPTRTDEFFLVSPREGDDRKRPLLPVFAPFNEHQDKTRRQFLRGNLVHAGRGGAFEHHLKAQMTPHGKMHLDARPWCVGDGERAFRWSGGEPDDFRSIVCPNEKCEYRQREANKMPACRPWMRLLFRPRWPDGNPLPTPLTKYTSMGWETIRGAIGMFQALELAMEQLGAKVPLYGYPITLTLIMRKKPSANRRYPVVIIAGETDPVTWVMGQRQRLEAIQAPRMAALTHDPTEAAEDYRLITPAPIQMPATRDRP